MAWMADTQIESLKLVNYIRIDNAHDVRKKLSFSIM